MNNTTKIVVAILAVGVIVGGAVLLAGSKSNNTTNTNTNDGTTNTPSTGNNSDNSGDNQTNQETTVTLTYTNSGFGSSSITVPSGSVLRVVNNSDDVIKPSSHPHPVHTDNPELNFPDIEPGQSASVTLTAKGTWGMHNHYDDDQHTTVVVE